MRAEQTVSARLTFFGCACLSLADLSPALAGAVVLFLAPVLGPRSTRRCSRLRGLLGCCCGGRGSRLLRRGIRLAIPIRRRGLLLRRPGGRDLWTQADACLTSQVHQVGVHRVQPGVILQAPLHRVLDTGWGRVGPDKSNALLQPILKLQLPTVEL